MSTKDEEFTNKALFDVDFEKDMQKSIDFNKKNSIYNQQSIQRAQIKEEESQQRQNTFNVKTDAFRNFESILSQTLDPQLKEQAIVYAESMLNKIDTFSSTPKISKEIDIDGSKKTLWGKIKNKIKNFTKPFNQKKTLENALSSLADAINKDPDTYAWLADMGKNKQGYTKLDKISDQYEKYGNYLNSERVDFMTQKEESQKFAQKTSEIIAKREQTIEAIHQVRDKAAKEIEQRMEARDNLGLSNMSSGTDKLAEKEEKMKNMSPQERLAYRMAEMRGTKKEGSSQPAKKITMDTNTLLQQKQQGRA